MKHCTSRKATTSKWYSICSYQSSNKIPKATIQYLSPSRLRTKPAKTIPVKTSHTSKPDLISETLITHQQRAIQHGSNTKNHTSKIPKATI
jgi:hypothetical protein